MTDTPTWRWKKDEPVAAHVDDPRTPFASFARVLCQCRDFIVSDFHAPEPPHDMPACLTCLRELKAQEGD